MARQKLKRFAELATFTNVVEISDPDFKRKVSDFVCDSTVVLELACGIGVYTLELAKRYPERKFIGIDIQGERLWYGSKVAKEEKLSNVLFIRATIENLSDYFEKQSLSEIWITFPDPHPKEKSEKHRLTNLKFLEMYQHLLKTNGILHLKTDNEAFFEYSLEQLPKANFKLIESIKDVYSNSTDPLLIDIQTRFEKKHLKDGRKIYYCQARII